MGATSRPQGCISPFRLWWWADWPPPTHAISRRSTCRRMVEELLLDNIIMLPPLMISFKAVVDITQMAAFCPGGTIGVLPCNDIRHYHQLSPGKSMPSPQRAIRAPVEAEHRAPASRALVRRAHFCRTPGQDARA